MIISLISGALLAAWTPNYFENMETKNYSKMRSEIRNILNIMTCFSVALILFGKEFGMILSPVKYHAGLIVLPVITVGCFFNSAWHLYGRHFIVSKKTYYITYLGILSALVNIGLNALFIPMYGYKVAAYTTLFSFIFMLIMSVLVTKYIIKIYPVTIKLMIRPVLFMLSAIFVFSSLEMITVNIVAKIIIKFVILMLMLYLSNIKFINLRLINKI
jgi:O-antigen/teichoic acid export membrane protein